MSARTVDKNLVRAAFREAGALLSSDCDSADLQCESDLPPEEADTVRELIRAIAEDLMRKGEGGGR